MSVQQVYSDFWLDQERFSDYIKPSQEINDEAFSIDLIHLASVRRLISNYVDILTSMSIPVYFKAIGDSENIGGKEIYITTAIKRRKDFDQAVGLALHEAAHTVESDFDIIKTIPFNAPKMIWEFGKKHNIRKMTLERFLKSMVNIIEDWFVDDWVINKAPGYMGYYEASYNVCFNTPTIDQILISNEYRFPSLASYEFRIINFTNPLTDLQALPGLEEIAHVIDITNISRLKTTKDRILTAYKIVEIVMKNLKQYHDKYNPQVSGNQRKMMSVDDFFKGSSSQSNSEKQPQNNGNEISTKSESTRTIKDVADTLGNRLKESDEENQAITSQTTKSPNREVPKEIKEVVDDQVKYVHGNTSKVALNPAQKTMLDLIEKHGIVLVYVPVPIEGNEAAFKVGCIVVKKLTLELIGSGQDLFPMANFWKDDEGMIQPDPSTSEAVSKGILLGSKLGKRLLIRREITPNKMIRKKSGKINRRLLYSAGFDAEDLFERIKIVKYNNASLHITVDASTSMSGEKWERTMTMCVAICKATSMIDNVHVTVSFRATKSAKGIEMPYIVQAYDSKIDKFSKVKNLFRYLRPCGCTPEGLAFGSIMNLFTEAVPDEEDRYFLNISDGEPYFNMKSPITGTVFHYGDGNGVEHTKNQINKIRRHGVQILSYYIQHETSSDLPLSGGHNTKKNFQMMYGRDAKFIKSDSVVELAKTMNELFLK